MGTPPAEESKVARFTRVALPYLEDAYRLACWLLRDDQDAKDAVQEAYLLAYQSLDALRGENARGWILAIVRNTCFSTLRKRKMIGPEQPFDEDTHSLDEAGLTVGQPENNPETLVLRKVTQDRIAQGIRSLPIKLREVLVLREIADMSYLEIAQIADIPVGTVMSRLARARDLLASHLKELDEAP